VVIRREYDPYKRALLNLLMYTNGLVSFNLAIKGIRVGKKVSIGSFVKPIEGNTSFLLNLKAGTFISNLELLPKLGVKYCRSVGAFAKLVSKKNYGYILIKLRKTKKQLKLNPFCVATVGVVFKSK